MADAIYWQLLESVQSGIRTALTFSTQSGDTAPAPKDAAVVIRKLPFNADDMKYDRSEDTPGIIISPVGATSPPDRRPCWRLRRWASPWRRAWPRPRRRRS